MLALNGIYDGKSVKITENFTEKKKYRVVVTFIEELLPADQELRNFSSNAKALEFWNDENEDLYQDFETRK